MTAPPDPLTVVTRLRWEAPKPDTRGGLRVLADLMAGIVYIGSVYTTSDGADFLASLTWREAVVYSTEAEARAALIAAVMEDLQYVG